MTGLNPSSAAYADPRVVADSSMDAGQRVTWDCVWLGSYPQTVVTDAATVAALDAATGWSSSGDLAYGGATYRRLGQSDTTHDYYYRNDFTKSPGGWLYFKWEPVKWRVLEQDGSTALVVADVALDGQRYHQTSTDVTWETCDLRSWLNGAFWGQALSPAQQRAVQTQTLANDDNIYWGTNGGGATTDNVFLLAESDVWSTATAARHGFVSSYSTYDEARRCQTSDYAHAMGAWLSTSSSYLGNCWWWLRSPGDYAYYAADVDGDGYVDRGGYYVDNDYFAVRPALRIYLSSNQISYAGTVCSDGTANEQAAPYSGTPGGSSGNSGGTTTPGVQTVTMTLGSDAQGLLTDDGVLKFFPGNYSVKPTLVPVSFSREVDVVKGTETYKLGIGIGRKDLLDNKTTWNQWKSNVEAAKKGLMQIPNTQITRSGGLLTQNSGW